MSLCAELCDPFAKGILLEVVQHITIYHKFALRVSQITSKKITLKF